MKNHLLLLLIFSLLTSIVLAFIAKNDLKERMRYFLILFASFVLLSIAAGWLMYPFPF